jgi:hypothetical protein
MIDDFGRENRKNRKNSFANHKKKNYSEISDEQKFVNKSRKELKHRIEDIRENELWEEWRGNDK